jgi:DNA-binding helix-hairpin-helix protein with protein kinase domain
LFARDVAEALAGIHQRGLVYQNLDPGSAVVAADARTAQLSWPIYCVPAGADARLRVLVPRYAAPEALSAAATTIEPALDVFGLGALLLFLLTGSAPPRGGESVSGFVRSKAADVTAATAAFVGELLAADPAARPTAAEALARARELSARLQGSGSQR